MGWRILYNHLKVYELKSKEGQDQTSKHGFISSSKNTSSGKVNVPTARISTAVVKFPLLALRKDPKVEEPAPKALMAMDGIGWDWSYMANEDENHALVADDVVPIEFALMDMSSSSSSSENEKEKESIDHKLAGFGNASKDLNDLLKSQKSAKDKTSVGFNEYIVVSPPPTQVYSSPKKDLSWMGLPEFVDGLLL
ncbi:hypothetical protein Tco_0271931 [Tanacetum coccineum]